MTALLHAPPADSAARSLPHSLEAERSILSSILQEPGEYLPAALEAGLQPDHFYLPAHAGLFRTLLQCDADGRPIELVSLTQHLRDADLLANMGGPAHLTEIYTAAATSAHWPHHLALVLDKAALRRAIAFGTDTVARAYDNPADLAAYLDGLETAALGIRHADDSGAPTTLASHLPGLKQRIDDYVSGRTVPHGLDTGFPDLDELLRGLKGGHFFVIAARPSMGKTALLLNLLTHLSLAPSAPAAGLLFSAEMTSEQILERLLFSAARVSLAEFKPGFALAKADLQRLVQATARIKAAPLHLDDTAAIPIDTLRAKARRLHQRSPLDYIAVDYLQLLRSTSAQAASSREREIADISNGLKALAKELALPIIALAQLNRQAENRPGGKPRMADLRESGAIEQDADQVALLFRPDYYADDADQAEELRGQAELFLAKNRHGPTGPVPLTWIAEHMTFHPRARTESPPPPAEWTDR